MSRGPGGESSGTEASNEPAGTLTAGAVSFCSQPPANKQHAIIRWNLFIGLPPSVHAGANREVPGRRTPRHCLDRLDPVGTELGRKKKTSVDTSSGIQHSARSAAQQ